MHIAGVDQHLVLCSYIEGLIHILIKVGSRSVLHKDIQNHKIYSAYAAIYMTFYIERKKLMVNFIRSDPDPIFLDSLRVYINVCRVSDPG